MDGKIWSRIFAGLVLLIAIAGIAFLAFNAGMAQNVQVPAEQAGRMPNAFYGWHGFGFPFLGCFGPLAALFLFFLALRAFSFAFWGPRWGHWGHWGHPGHLRRAMRHGWYEEDGEVPPMVKDWHDKMHGNADPEKKED